MKRTRPLEHLSKRQREATPLPFAEYLLRRVRETFGSQLVAVLWTQRRSIYQGLADTDCWGVERDARLYPGPFPIVAHPPCGPWGKYAVRCNQDREDGRIALRLVHRYGGVVEQPLGSGLFRECEEPFLGSVEYVEQGAYGHQARKPTLLYWVRRPLIDN